MSFMDAEHRLDVEELEAEITRLEEKVERVVKLLIESKEWSAPRRDELTDKALSILKGE